MIVRSQIRKRRSKLRRGQATKAEKAMVRAQRFELDGYRCQHIKTDRTRPYRCLKRVTWDTGHLAHVIPRSRGGAFTVENTLTKCAECHIGIEHSYGPSGQKPCPRKVPNV